MKKRFIILTDLSAQSEWILRFADSWATQIGAELHLLHHSQALTPGFGDSEILTGLKQDQVKTAKHKVKAFALDVLGDATHIRCTAASGSMAASITDLAKEGIDDFLFVGMKNKSFAENLLAGSTAIELTNEIDNIIVALPQAADDIRFDQLHVAVKELYPLQEDEFDKLLSIHEGRIDELHFFTMLRMGEDATRAEAYLDNLAAHYRLRMKTSYAIYRSENVFAGIKQHMTDNKGMLVVQRGSRSMMDMFRKFFITDVVHNAHIPLIILP